MKIRRSEEGSTFFEEGIGSALDEQQGRFGKREPVISGGEPSVQYPRLPEDNPQNQHAKVPDEPPLGWSVSAPIVVGEFYETEGVAPLSSSPFSNDGGAPSGQIDPGFRLPSPVEQSEPEGISPKEEEIDDGWVGPRRADGTPMSTSVPKVRRA
jgi:hypothetical protein